MVDGEILSTVRRYLQILPEIGIHPRRAILYGSFARGEADQWSDIDLVVIAPEFDRPFAHSLIEDMWGARARADIRIEPIPCGEREWETETGRTLLEIAHREGIVIAT